MAMVMVAYFVKQILQKMNKYTFLKNKRYNDQLVRFDKGIDNKYLPVETLWSTAGGQPSTLE